MRGREKMLAAAMLVLAVYAAFEGWMVRRYAQLSRETIAIAVHLEDLNAVQARAISECVPNASCAACRQALGALSQFAEDGR